ncbi:MULTISPECIES: type II toxin-antitoxin system Phd/YefM family antitoxin [Bacillales]|jgi:PHD/YefM family antitoxin component YafN of YafNO toxin-antitoxin module|uniref:PHD/YefM family antitoxin component YafN of YafNO toxin-antitoxin module n=1 Tax=Anoxybacillus andreesenii TaxID=1325932 RepID=A0ABT9V3R4_9BACL|nr:MULTISPECIES: type II toxin-antitoxin system Phd/YefM family antitoxin [Bacillaceae]KXI97534.1 prevent-host-death protein [Bacillus cereus]MBU8790932.1 type II toxin-antitoxin system Phd/YefM family antitoxin [Oceanobacillus caeni]MCU5244175.1 type II toxin-antitoxin system Phd/YefM family antitoxin [Bacillus pacificus]MCU5416660.1 type II toxin-antitoxin system Phd/YefM family antitoxin [Bacillus pacificus]MCU5465974.1 type II toxin-antitoxin system Phd/YefM family antitoxin [Bacillus paci
MESEDKIQKQPMDFYNMSDFLRGQSSKLITKLSDEDRTAFVLKNGKPIAVLLSNERYERLLKSGIDITEY